MKTIRIKESNSSAVISKTFLTSVLLGLLVLLIFLDFPLICGGQSHIHDHDHEDAHGHSHGHSHEPPSYKYSKEANKNAPDTHPGGVEGSRQSTVPNKERNISVLWLQAFGSTLLISIAPVFILYLVPLDNSKEREPFLKILLSFASGGLLGDAFLHLIPHALVPHNAEHAHPNSHSHSHSHSHDSEEGHGHDMSVGLWVLCGILTFLVVEKFVRLVKGGHEHSHDVPKASPQKKKDKQSDSEDEDEIESDIKTVADEVEKKLVTKKTDTVSPNENEEDIKVAGYLNLAADFTHNFTDGLAIGASYLAGKNVGIVTTITILLHEVPHEIGDYAILIQSGCSRRKAMLLQFTTAVGAMAGTFVSLLAEGIDHAATLWILPFTAGGFIYIATVSVIPELLTDTKFWQSVKEILALLVGVYMMVLIAEYE